MNAISSYFYYLFFLDVKRLPDKLIIWSFGIYVNAVFMHPLTRVYKDWIDGFQTETTFKDKWFEICDYLYSCNKMFIFQAKNLSYTPQQGRMRSRLNRKEAASHYWKSNMHFVHLHIRVVVNLLTLVTTIPLTAMMYVVAPTVACWHSYQDMALKSQSMKIFLYWLIFYPTNCTVPLLKDKFDLKWKFSNYLLILIMEGFLFIKRCLEFNGKTALQHSSQLLK